MGHTYCARNEGGSSGKCRLVQELHWGSKTFEHVAFSNDGKLLAANGYIGLFVWKIGEYEPIYELPGYGDVAFSPTQNVLAAGSGKPNYSAALWNMDTGTLIRELGGKSVNSFAFNSDGTILATANTDDLTIYFWRVEDGSRTAELEGHDRFVSQMEFSKDDSILVSASIGELRIWNPETKELISSEKKIGYMIKKKVLAPISIRLSHDGNVLAEVWEADSPGSDTSTRLKLINDTGNTCQLSGSSKRKQVVFSPDGNFLASVEEKSIGIWRSDDCSLLRVLKADNVPTSVAFSPDSKLLASGYYCLSGKYGYGYGVRIWDIGDLILSR